MPYYCTVPRCTSMAGKAKNVSFHQFPRDEELAQLWNEILKRGKPYTKYSKVCSLHFKPEDYTVTSVGKNKGQWRTLRKDAIPSRNLPTDTPTGHQRTRSTNSWTSGSLPPNLLEPQIHQQMAQAIYMQTMLAMQAVGDGLSSLPSPQNSDNSIPNSTAPEQTSDKTLSEYEKFLISRQIMASPSSPESDQSLDGSENNSAHVKTEEIERFKRIQSITYTECKGLIGDRLKNGVVKSFKCDECSKCFKDPDVFVLHRRTHSRKLENQELHNNKTSDNGINEKENLNINTSDIQNEIRQDTLKANPILANLLKSGVQHRNGNDSIQFDPNAIWNLENQIMAAMAANMEAYIRNLASMMTNSNFKSEENAESKQNNQNSETEDRLENTETSTDEPQSETIKSTDEINVITSEISNGNVNVDFISHFTDTDPVEGENLDNDMNLNKFEGSTQDLVQNSIKNTEDLNKCMQTERVHQVSEPNCDIKDLVE